MDALASFNANSVAWAVSRWQAEVSQRPLVNVHRRTLDGVWRQVVRHFGGDPDALLGPDHDTLAWRQRAVDEEARKLYEDSQDDSIHCNRYPAWSELNEAQKNQWRGKLASSSVANGVAATAKTADGTRNEGGA